MAENTAFPVSAPNPQAQLLNILPTGAVTRLRCGLGSLPQSAWHTPRPHMGQVTAIHSPTWGAGQVSDVGPMQKCSSAEGSSEHPEKRGRERPVGRQWDTGKALSEEQFKGMTRSRM